MGNMDLAKQMIYESHKNGSDFVKFQTWSTSRLKSWPWYQDGRREIYEKAELSLENHVELKNYCDEIGIEFFSSVFSLPDAKLLSKVQNKYVKIASFESRNIELIKMCDALFKTIFLSTGTSSLDEIKITIEHIRNSEVVLLHCVSSYPLDYENANLPRIAELKKINKIVGYSDHTFGINGSKVACDFGINYLEKHFTTDQNLPGRDNKFSILPKDLRDLKKYIDIREAMKIDHGNSYLECESEAREVMTGRFNG